MQGFTLPTEPADRRKFYFAAGLLAICTIWLAYYLISNTSIPKTTQAPSSPGWTVVNEINTKLIQDHAYADVGLALEQEKPLKVVVNGAVYRQSDLDKLPELLKSLNADPEYDIKVELLRR